MENKMPPLTLGRLDKHYLVVRSAGQNCYGGNEGYTIYSIPSLLLFLVLVIIIIP